MLGEWSTPGAEEGAHRRVNWGTPRAGTHGGMGRDRGDNKARLEDQIHEEWATPRSSAHARNARPLSEAGLSDWPTPTAADADRASEKYARGNPTLRGAAAQEWPTPRANDPEKRGNFDTASRRNGLPAAVGQGGQPDAESGSGHGSPREWCTPTRRDEKGPGPEHTKGGRDLAKDAAGKLNPDWVEALMGAPPGWTDLPAETVSELWATRTRRTSRS